ncbi:MAG: helix-turn-helix domain-containing protein, partial [Rubrivivax sp.]|nr:helix-turn-helix domain-containing protein [Rubrivivax sp.]
MDSLVAAAARALAAGDAIGALKRVSLRDDPPALALRGIAMAQLGEHARSRELLRRAARGFGAHEALARARCVVADAEVALAMRELATAPRALVDAAETLEARGDHVNALHARLVVARRWLLLGRLGEAAVALQAARRPRAKGTRPLPPGPHTPPSLQAVAELAAAELALRS